MNGYGNLSLFKEWGYNAMGARTMGWHENPEMAILHLKKAEKLKCIAAYHNLGVCYYKGVDVPCIPETHNE